MNYIEIHLLDVTSISMSRLSFYTALNVFVQPQRIGSILSSNSLENQRLACGAGLLSIYSMEKNNINPFLFRYSNLNKPYLPDETHTYISLTHSGKYAGVALSRKPVGIDVQSMEEGRIEIMNHFYDEQEKEAVSLSDELEKKRRFYEIWCKKEAYIKVHGYQELDTIHTMDERIKNSFHVIQIDHHMCAIYNNFNKNEIHISIVTEDDILQQISKTKIDELRAMLEAH